MAPTRGPNYQQARITAFRVHPRFVSLDHNAAHLPTPEEIEALIDVAFWGSLRREEGASPKISMAFVSPEDAGPSLTFENSLELTADAMGRLAAAAERPGVHLGVWRSDGVLRIWGATRAIPAHCFVIEVVSPGLVVLKYRRFDADAKFVNVAVLEGDTIKVLDSGAHTLPDCPGLVSALLGFERAEVPSSVNVLVELAVSMRSHQRGGTLLVVPSGSDEWRESIRHPIHYSVAPRFARLSELMDSTPADRESRTWQDHFHRTVEAIAGLTAVDGATVITDHFEVLAFGAKIRRREGWESLENVLMSEPVEGFEPHILPTLQTGGTRHLSAAQFAADQRDSMAMVASQDGRFTVFSWSSCDKMVRAHRVETLLL